MTSLLQCIDEGEPEARDAAAIEISRRANGGKDNNDFMGDSDFETDTDMKFQGTDNMNSRGSADDMNYQGKTHDMNDQGKNSTDDKDMDCDMKSKK